MRNKIIPALIAALSASLVSTATAQAVFSPAERARIVGYWSSRDRWTVSVPDANRLAPWQVRLTPEGSAWLYKYQDLMGAGKKSPTVDPATLSAIPAWKTWVQKKAVYDRWLAQQVADGLNADMATRLSTDRAAGPRGRGRGTQPTAESGAEPQPPGPMPFDLLRAAGNAPSFAAPVTPLQHTIKFDDGDSCVFVDHRNVPATYAYYRHPQGVGHPGTAVDDAERARLFSAAALTETQQRVMMAVSRLEGSFDAVNTYDTGFVSIGFVQFVTMEDGRHSLADVLATELADNPREFERDFRGLGVGLAPDHLLAIVDPSTGAELQGPDAVLKVIDDTRLAAIFHRAGRTSSAFRVAQIRVAKSGYWPEDDALTVEVDGRTLTGKVSDVVRSEAGLATFFDRKVNRGNIDPLAEVVGRTMKAHRLKRLTDAARYEREIIAACKYRADFLMDGTLTQPGR